MENRNKPINTYLGFFFFLSLLTMALEALPDFLAAFPETFGGIFFLLLDSDF